MNAILRALVHLHGYNDNVKSYKKNPKAFVDSLKRIGKNDASLKKAGLTKREIGEETLLEGRDTYKKIIDDLLKDKKTLKSKGRDTNFIDKAINFLKQLEKKGIPATQISQVDFVTNRIPKFFVGNPNKSPSFSKFTPNDVNKAVAHAKKVGVMENLQEGTWAIPDSKNKLESLNRALVRKHLIKKEGDLDMAARKFAGLVGDDTVMDEWYQMFLDYENVKKVQDAREPVVDFLQKWGCKVSNYKITHAPATWVSGMDDDEKDIRALRAKPKVVPGIPKKKIDESIEEGFFDKLKKKFKGKGKIKIKKQKSVKVEETINEAPSILAKDIRGLKHISDIEIRFSDEKEWKRMSAFVKRELKKPAYKGIKSKDVYYSPDPLQIGFGAGKGNSKINIKPIVDIIVQQTKDPKTRLKSLYEAKKPSKMGGSKLTGQEISVYFRKNPKAKSNAMVKKAVEIALDHGGAMNYAIDKIEKLKRGLSKNKDVAKALNYANFGENNEEIKPYYKGFELVMQEALSRADQIKLASFGTTLSKITGFKWEKDKDPEVAMDRLFGQIRSKGKYSPANWERIHKMVGLLDKIGVKLPSLKGFYMGWDKKTGKGLFHEEIESIKEGIEEIVEAQTMSDADIKKIAGMTDRNDHNGSMMHLAKALKNKKAQEIMASLMKIHKSMGHMPAGGVQIRNDLMKILMSDAKKKYRNHADIYSAF